MSTKRGGLRAIANALNDDDLARAQIATVLLGIPDPPRLSKRDRSRDQMIKLIRDLHWSGMLKWDPDEHPRWPAGSSDGRGGQFAPKGEGDESDASSSLSDIYHTRQYGSEQSVSHPNARVQLADMGTGDAADDPIAEAVARTTNIAPSWPEDEFAALDGTHRHSESDDTPELILAAAEGGDESDPRFGIGGNYPPPEELIPQALQQSPAGPAVQFLNNILELSAPGDEANFGAATVQMKNLLHAIHDVDPNYVYESLDPTDGLAHMSWQGRLNVIHGLQADLAAAIYRVRGDIKPLQEVTLEFMQRTTNSAYDEAVELYIAGKLKVRLSPQEAIGNYMDGVVRRRLNGFLNSLGIPVGSDSAVQVNNRAYNSSNSPPSYRLPDVRVGSFAFDTSLTAKQRSDPQIKGFFAADFSPVGVVIVRPNQLSGSSSYIIWRTDGE